MISFTGQHDYCTYFLTILFLLGQVWRYIVGFTTFSGKTITYFIQADFVNLNTYRPLNNKGKKGCFFMKCKHFLLTAP